MAQNSPHSVPPSDQPPAISSEDRIDWRKKLEEFISENIPPHPLADLFSQNSSSPPPWNDDDGEPLELWVDRSRDTLVEPDSLAPPGSGQPDFVDLDLDKPERFKCVWNIEMLRKIALERSLSYPTTWQNMRVTFFSHNRISNMDEEQRKHPYEFRPGPRLKRLSYKDLEKRLKKAEKDWNNGVVEQSTAERRRNLRRVKKFMEETSSKFDRTVCDRIVFLGLGTMDDEDSDESIARHIAAFKMIESITDPGSHLRIHFWDPDYSYFDGMMIKKYITYPTIVHWLEERGKAPQVNYQRPRLNPFRGDEIFEHIQDYTMIFFFLPSFPGREIITDLALLRQVRPYALVCLHAVRSWQLDTTSILVKWSFKQYYDEVAFLTWADDRFGALTLYIRK